MKINFILLFILALILSSCGNDDEATAIAPITTTGTSPLTLPDAFSALSSSLAVASATVAPGLCSGGSPTSAVGSATFATDKVFCSLSSVANNGQGNTPTGSDGQNANQGGGVSNAFTGTSGILCALQNAGPFTNSTTPTVHNGVNLNESDSTCFANSNGEFDIDNSGEIDSNVITSFRETALPPQAQGYDRIVEVQFNHPTFDPAVAPNIVYYSKNSNNILASKVFQNSGAVTETALNRATGEMFYENRDYRSFKHDRLYLKGTMDATGALSSVSNIQAIQALGNTGAESYSVLYASDGTNKWADHFVGITRAPGYPMCVGVCNAIAIPYNAQFHNFTANPQTSFNHPNLMAMTVPINMFF